MVGVGRPLRSRWDREFESPLLQRRVACEPEFSGGYPINARRTFQLQQRGIEKIIVVGVLANTCVEATARCSAKLGYHVTLVRDAPSNRLKNSTRGR